MKEQNYTGRKETAGFTGEELQNGIRKTMERYGDILEAKRPYDPARQKASPSARAAQFSPFAALTGYEAEIMEEARLTDCRIELSESQKEALDAVLREAEDRTGNRKEQPFMRAVYFRPDERKSGGAYISKQGKLKKIDRFSGLLVFADGSRVRVEDLSDLAIVEEAEDF